MEKIRRYFKNEEGVTAIEYSLIAGLIALVIIVAMSMVGVNLYTNFYEKISSSVAAATGS